MRKLKEDLRVGILGAAAGLFSICIPLMIARIDAYYTYLSWLNESHYPDTYFRPVEDLSWIPFAAWHLILSVAAALLAHRHLSTRVRSPFLLWQVIGIASLLGWGVTVFLVIGMGCLMRGDLYPVEHLFNSDATVFMTKYVSAGFASNVLYSSIMKSSSRQYNALDELASDSANVDHFLTTS